VPKKAKDRSRSKVPRENVVPAEAPSLRGSGAGRGEGPRRGGDSVRGGRGRGTDRGRGAFSGARGGRGGAINTTPRAASAVTSSDAAAWDTTPAATESSEPGQTAESAKPTDDQSTVAAAATAVAGAAKKTWASMFSAPKPVPAVPKPAEKPSATPEEAAHEHDDTPAHDVAHEPASHPEELPTPPVADEAVQTPPITAQDPSAITPDKTAESTAPELTLTPSKDELTVENVEHLPDESHPPPTETVFSTVASSKDIGSAVATPLHGPTHPPIGRPGIGGYATTALKATSGQHRSASFQRKLVEQHEAVVMPGNHAVDRAAVQFGSLGLGNTSDMDVDEDREEAETREQPPQHSPVAQPRAALPPAPRQAPQQTEAHPQESVPTPKQAPGLPPAPQQQPLGHQSPSNTLASQAMQNQGSQSNHRYEQFGRYGQAGNQPESTAPPQKSYDPFGQQIPQQTSQYDYPGQQSQAPSQPGAFSSAPDNYGSQYLTADQRYQQYYGGGYGQQGAQSQQEAGSAQQRTGSAFGAGPNDSAFSQSQQQVRHSLAAVSASSRLAGAPSRPIITEAFGRQFDWVQVDVENLGVETVTRRSIRQASNESQQGQSRYNDSQNSGHNTPIPGAGVQQPGGPGAQGQHMQQHGGQQGQHGGAYPYNHPYYNSPYYTQYMNQFGGYGAGGSGYGSFGKGMYGQPHHYGMSPQASYDQHSSSPANVGGFGSASSHERPAGLGEYGRSASGMTQGHSATAGAGGFGGFSDSFGRQQSYANQSSYGQQQGGQPGANEDSLKPFGDAKSTGPSPSALGAQQGRPGSATQNASGQGGPQQSGQGFGGGYPSHLGGGNSQYGAGLGGLGHQGNSQHQQSQYGGNYGGFSGGYGGGNNGGGGGGGSYNRGGWGGNYGHN
jgi:hypothetical protein